MGKKYIERRPRVILMIAPNDSTHLEIRQGIFRYLAEKGRWLVKLSEGRIDELRIAQTDFDDCDGVICKNAEPRTVRAINTRRIPTVSMEFDPRIRTLVGTIDCDNKPIGRAAADWLVKRGFSNFAYVGNADNRPWSIERELAFSARLAQCHRACATFRQGQPGKSLKRWLLGLPKPVALFAANDITANQVRNLCEEARISIPRDVSILSVDNYRLLCENSLPPLSSIQMTTEETGYRAAQLLDQCMRSNRRPIGRPKSLLYTFSHIVERDSVALLTRPDQIVERALEFIRLNYSRRISIDDLSAALKVSKRSLHSRFKKITGRSPHNELLRYRLEQAKNLTTDTALPFEEIALSCGFSSATHLNHRFREQFGRSPGSFRSKASIRAV